jgi:hypothetical protein
MSLGYVLKQYQPKKVMYSKVLSIRNNKRKLILYLYTGIGKTE